MRSENNNSQQSLRAWFAYFITSMCLLIASCTGVGYMVGGSIQNFQGKYSIDLTRQYPDILDLVAAVGKSMSLDVSSIDSSKGEIQISTGTVTTSGILLGNQNYQSISVKSTNGGRHVDIIIGVQGNFGHGTKDAADKLFAEFKSKLLEISK
ncbi:MAG TPA: hypothetical protein VLX91_01905 [Candidatus Acidoferrales bacterium]|nr:hypothetical protein [Candidatus Acidoferrales bacterium]